MSLASDCAHRGRRHVWAPPTDIELWGKRTKVRLCTECGATWRLGPKYNAWPVSAPAIPFNPEVHINQPAQEGNHMSSILNRKHFAELFRVDYQTVTVTFDGATGGHREYTYKAPKSLSIDVNDKLMVKVVSSRNGAEYKVVTVQEVHLKPEVQSEASFNYKWIIGKLDTIEADHQANVAKDNRLKIAVEKLERRLAAVNLRRELTALLGELPEGEADEFRQLFNIDVNGQTLLPGADVP